jgi:hypothetical protein
MIRSVFSAFRLLIRLLLALILIAGLVFVAFAGYKGSQPMQPDGANGMTYWQFMRERIGAIRELPAKCQQMHLTGYLIAVPVYPVLYTYVGMFPDGAPLADHLVRMPDPAFLLPALHLALVDWAPGWVVIIAITVGLWLTVLGFAGLILWLANARPEGVWRTAVLEQVSDGIGSFLEQLRAILTTQGNLAFEAIWVDIAGVPGGRRFAECQLAWGLAIGLGGLIVIGVHWGSPF